MSEKLSTLGTLVSGVAHEIRTPLTYVTGQLFLLRQRLRQAVEASPELDGVARDLLKHETAALDGMARIDRLVEDLRRFTTHRMGETVEADLRDVVAVAVDLFRATRGGRIEVQADLASAPALPVDRGQVQQVVLNLLNNSAEAMPAGGRVRIATRAVPGGGEIEVEDHGAGLPPEVEAQLFRPFFTTKPEGTGLGLSICQRIIEAHGGQIRYQTRPGEGTTFVIFLPDRRGG
jgi:two-component system NtrC family sensor kinase